MITKAAKKKAIAFRIPIHKILPDGFITLENARQMGILIDRKKDAYLDIGNGQCLSIWNMADHPEMQKPKIISYLGTHYDHLFHFDDCRDCYLPVKEGEKPAAYLMRSDRFYGERKGASPVYTPLYYRKGIETQTIVRKMVKSMRIQKVTFLEEREMEVKLTTKAGDMKTIIPIEKEGAGYRIVNHYRFSERKTVELAFLLSVLTVLFTGGHSMKLLLHNLTPDMISVPFKKTVNAEEVPTDPNGLVSLEWYLDQPMYENHQAFFPHKS